jgi:hypothetical protein
MHFSYKIRVCRQKAAADCTPDEQLTAIKPVRAMLREAGLDQALLRQTESTARTMAGAS